MAKSPEAFRTISEVADWLGTPAHVLRFWESRFAQVKPVKRAGGRRYYRPADMELLGGIKQLLHEDGMTIRGVQKLLRTEGVRHVASFSMPLDSPTEGAMPAQAAQDNAPALAAADPVIEAPMSENVEPDPLDNLVALAPSQPVAAQPVNTAQVADDMAAVVPPEPAPAPEPTAGPEPEPAPETPEIAATDQHPAMAEIPPESDTATPLDAPVPPSEADHGSPAPLFQSAQSMRSSAEAVQPSVTDPVVPAQDTSAGAEAVAPTPPEPAHDMRPAPLGADIAEDPAPDAQFADAPLAPLPNIISLAQAMRAHRNGTDGPAVDAGMMARFYDQLIELRDQMRAKG